METIHARLQALCAHHDALQCGLLSLAHLTEAFSRYGIRPGTLAVIARFYTDPDSGLVYYPQVVRHLASPTHAETYYPILRAFNADPMTYICNFFGLPLGFREVRAPGSSLAPEIWNVVQREWDDWSASEMGPRGPVSTCIWS